jgi:hypothetical protein
MAVTVVTRGDIRSDGWFAQGHGLSVVGLAIMRQPIFVASAAARIAGHFEVAIARRFNFVRRVAIGADGPAFVALGQQLAVDALVVGLFDPDVAFATGAGNFGFVNG